MSAHGHDLPKLKVDDLIASMDDRSSGIYALSVLLSLLGVAGFIAGVLSDPQRAWTALVWNWSLWSGIAVGGAAVGPPPPFPTGTGYGRCGGSRRAHRVPAVSYLIMIVMLFGLEHVLSGWAILSQQRRSGSTRPSSPCDRSSVSRSSMEPRWRSSTVDAARPRAAARSGRRVEAEPVRPPDGGWDGEDVELERAAAARAKLAPAYASFTLPSSPYGPGTGSVDRSALVLDPVFRPGSS